MIGRQPVTRWVDGVHTVCGTADTESAASTRRPHRGPALQVHGGDEKGRAVMRWVDVVSRRWRWGTADTESDSSRSLAPQAGTAADLSITADVACGVNDAAVCQHRTATASAMIVSTVTCGPPATAAHYSLTALCLLTRHGLMIVCRRSTDGCDIDRQRRRL